MTSAVLIGAVKIGAVLSLARYWSARFSARGFDQIPLETPSYCLPAWLSGFWPPAYRFILDNSACE